MKFVEGLVAPKNTPSPADASPESIFAHDLVQKPVLTFRDHA
jgi:hypothetical protein